jgi:hypothetical protein
MILPGLEFREYLKTTQPARLRGSFLLSEKAQNVSPVIRLLQTPIQSTLFVMFCVYFLL